MASISSAVDVNEVPSTENLNLGVQVVIQLAVIRAEPYEDAVHPQDYALALISHELAGEMPARCSLCSNLFLHECDKKWTVERHWKGNPARQEDTNAAGDDATAYIDDSDRVYTIELHSPVFNLSRSSTPQQQSRRGYPREHVVNWNGEVSAVLNLLDNMLGSPKVDGYGVESFLYAPRSAQLKTTIVSQTSLALQTAKNIAVLSQACARQIDTLQSANSIGDVVLESETTTTNGGWETNKVEDAGEDNSRDVDFFITMLQPSENVKAVAMSILRMNLDPVVKFGSYSVTFSQHAATLDPRKVLCWIDVVSKIVQRSHKLPFYYVFVESTPFGDLRQPEFTAYKFSKMLQYKSSTIKHYMRWGAAVRARQAVEKKKIEEAERALWAELMLGEFAVHVADEAVADDDVDEIDAIVVEKIKGGKYGHVPRWSTPSRQTGTRTCTSPSHRSAMWRSVCLSITTTRIP